jgi:hypothetical protein
MSVHRALLVLVSLGVGGRACASVLYACSSQASRGGIYTVDPGTGVASLIGASGFTNLTDLASDTRAQSFRLWACDGATNQLLRINPQSGAGTAVGSLNISGGIQTLAFDESSGFLYGTSVAFDRLYRINPDTAAATLVTAVGVTVYSPIASLGFDAGGTLYGTQIGGTGGWLARINTGNGEEFGVGIAPGQLGDIACRPEDGVMFAADGLSGGLYRLNVNSAGTTLVGPLGAGIGYLQGLAFGPVPAPGSALPMLALLAGARRRRHV